jgi:methylmalonyl-CoA mutase
MKEFLFDEFNPVSAKQWKQKIQMDLKGADYNDTLLYKTNEGVHIKPFYHQDDLKLDIRAIPGHPKTWRAAQHIFVDDEKIVNKLIIDRVLRGAESIVITAQKEFDFTIVFDSFEFSKIAIHLDLKFISKEFYDRLCHFLSKNKATVCYNIDIIGNLTNTGNWYHNLNFDHLFIENFIKDNPRVNSIGVDMRLYQNAGANIVQQLAYGLSHVNEYLNHFNDKDLNQNSNITPTFKVACGTNYFFEISKLRALRKLYAVLAKEYRIKNTCHILAMPSKRNKTLYDYNVNMLRTTTECMSAILGGADTIYNLPYDVLYHKNNEFAERISRNQLLILKAESHFDTVSNPADGAYYIEMLTNELAEKALQLFKEIEASGGFLKQLKDGIIQKKIDDSAQKEQKQFDAKELVLVGTNNYINSIDAMKDQLELFPFLKVKSRKTLIKPIIERRLSETIEQERLNNE